MKTVEHIDLVTEAKSKISDIQQLLRRCPKTHRVVLYINDNGGYTLGTIQYDWHTRTPGINFGNKNKSIETIEEIITTYENFQC